MSDPFAVAAASAPDPRFTFPLSAENVPMTGKVGILDVSKLIDRDAYVVTFTLGAGPGDVYDWFQSRPVFVNRKHIASYLGALVRERIYTLRYQRRKAETIAGVYHEPITDQWTMPTDSEGAE